MTELQTEFDDIWQFVERKIRVEIPPFLKYVLKFCGYENFHTISTIQEDDFEYFESEVRKSDIIQFYKGKVTEKDLMKGSPKSIENFEIIRGHRKLLMVAVQVVKEKLDESGANGILSVSPKKKKQNQVAARKSEKSKVKSVVPRKIKKFSSSELLNEPLDEMELQNDHTNPVTDPHINHHKRVLFLKALSCLKTHNSETYVEKLPLYKKTLTEDSMQLSKKSPDSLQYTAKIKCPHCKERTTVFHKLSESEYGSWNESNFLRHLLKVHKAIAKSEAKTKEDTPREAVEKSLDQDLDEKNDINLAIGSIVDMKDVEIVPFTSSKIISIVNYSDSEDEDDDVHEFLFERLPGQSYKVIEKEVEMEATRDCDKNVLSDTYILPSNETEIIAEISIENYSASFNAWSNEDILQPGMYDNNFQRILNIIDPRLAVNVKREEDPEFKDKFAIVASTIENIPIFRNGFKSKNAKPMIYTVNTCAFDSIFSIFTSLYFDYPNYREYTDLFVGRSNFSLLVQKYFETFNSKSKLKVNSELSGELYEQRNHILKELFSTLYYKKNDNVIKNSKYTFINCSTAIGGLFGQICMEMAENIGSSIETKICLKCEMTHGKILPFVSIDVKDIDCRNIEKCISLDRSQEKLCTRCKSEYLIENIYNNVLVLEVEPNCEVKYQTTVTIQNITETITVGKKSYILFGVIQFKPSVDHFVAHVRRRDNGWKTFDDLASVETETNTAEEILPYMLFYINRTAPNAFKTSLLSFFQKNKLQKPMMRKILSSERSAQDQKEYAQSSSTSTSAEWKKKREKEWKY